tara:strand:- start:380 stop:610 length:231 start_codon:yes stop_codon:yes gene_type:complete
MSIDKPPYESLDDWIKGDPHGAVKFIEYVGKNITDDKGEGVNLLELINENYETIKNDPILSILNMKERYEDESSGK